jgi:Secretion system C-terminal sorting domain
MKNLLLCLWLLPVWVTAQNPVVEWAKSYGGSSVDYGNSINVTKDNKYVIAGNTWSNDGDLPATLNGKSDAWLLKVNENGNILWSKTYGGNSFDSFYGSVLTSDNGFILVGSTSGDSTLNKTAQSDVWIVKTDSLGNIQWQKTMGGSKSEIVSNIFETQNGDFFFGVSTQSNDGDFPQNSGDYDAWVIKLNSRGNLIWKKRISGSGYDYIYKIVNIDDKTFAIAIKSKSEDGDFTNEDGISSFKMDSSGNIVWRKYLTYPWLITGLAEFRCVASDRKSITWAGMMIVNQNDLINRYSWDLIVVKTDTSGNTLWSKKYGGLDTDAAEGVKYFPNGDLTISGNTLSNQGNVNGNNGLVDIWVLRLDSLGNLKNANCYGGAKLDHTTENAIDKRGNLITIGYSESINGIFAPNRGLNDLVILKLNYGLTSIEDNNTTTLNSIEYPNPVSNYLTIKLPNVISPINISIKNMVGQNVYYQQNISQELNIDFSSFSSGIYFLTYKIGDKSFTKKIVKNNF